MPIPRPFVVAPMLLGATVLLGLTGLGETGAGLVLKPLSGARAWLMGATVTNDPGPQQVAAESVIRLQAQNREMRERLASVGALLEAAGPGALERGTLLECRILGRSRDEGHHYLELDRGAIDGVTPNAPVMVGWSLVGVVRGEQAGRSLVMLLTDQDSRIPVSVQDGQGQWVAEGVAAGRGTSHSIDLILVEDRPGLALEPGMPVVTSPVDGRLPGGLVVGRLTAASKAPDTDLWTASIAALRPWGSYATVLVLRSAPPPGTAP